jgi:tetratricopeptide (TPR) repeat protein
MRRAFIVRPFGVKSSIRYDEAKKEFTKTDFNFDVVEEKLIGPALDRLGIKGRTTGEIVGQGNIRTDMFELLLTADLVVADLSVHNANVFYELGIRHSLRDKHTFQMRSDTDSFPFDLQTDRYFLYKREIFGAEAEPDKEAALKKEAALEETVEKLVKALRETIDSGKTNSPVFSSLPNMKEQDPSQFIAVPFDFGEEVGRAADGKQRGDLRLLAAEVKKDFSWGKEGLRVVGRAQFDLKDFTGARATWEAVRDINPFDLEANLLLGTIYERLGRLTDSTDALKRALSVKDIEKDKKAEAYALRARNSKTLWRKEWEAEPAAGRPETALRSGHLKDSFEDYERAFAEDLNHFYSGLNALAMVKVQTELAGAFPDVWAEPFDDDEAEKELKKLRERAAKLAGAVEVSLDATLARLKAADKKDVWAEISTADLCCLTSDRPKKVVAAYRDALAVAPDFAKASVRNQLAIYRDLGVLTANVSEVFKFVGEPEPEDAGAKKQQRVLIFTGHMIDAGGRKNPRFPADKEDVARQKIKEKVEAEMKAGEGVSFGIAGGSSGGDILFHEVCAELGIPTRLYLAIPPQRYVTTSVQKARSKWVERFWALYNEHQTQKQVRALSDAHDEQEFLPAWLREKPDYSIWQRNNLWTLFNALDEGCDPKSDDPNLTLIALWDGQTGDGPGGTGDLVDKVEGLGARCEILKTTDIF